MKKTSKIPRIKPINRTPIPYKRTHKIKKKLLDRQRKHKYSESTD